jgi:hypothetical protein
MEKITVITVTYNSYTSIQNMLESINSQSNCIRELIIVENNSKEKDDTRRIVNEYKKKIKIPITFITHPNHGYGTSSNYGAKFAKSKYLLFLNPDTILNTNSISTLIKHHVAFNSDISGLKLVNEKKQLSTSIARFPNLYYGIFHLTNIGKVLHYENARKQFLYENDQNIVDGKNDALVESVSGACMLISRELFKKLGGFDENIFLYLEDVDICYRAHLAGKKIMYCPHAKLTHIGGSSSNNKNRINQPAWFRSRKYYYLKNTNTFTNIIIQPVFAIDEIATRMRDLLRAPST